MVTRFLRGVASAWETLWPAVTARDRGRARPHFLVSGRILAFLHLTLGRPTLRIGVEGDIAGAGVPIEKSREITLKLQY